jgi:ParB-like chromosome segregation protein Spo0J
MKIIEVPLDDLVLSEDMQRSGSAKQFEERLRSSIEEIGLAEPIKVALMPSGKYLVIDGTMRLRAITAIREVDKSVFSTIPAYLTDYDKRFEIRYQTDIYQDLLPSQLATLVEHLHQAEGVRKVDIARYVGVSPATVRNYTGLWRLLQRGGLFARVVDLMDAGVIPASNPYAWLRLTDAGLRYVVEQRLSDVDDESAEAWIERHILAARQGHVTRLQTIYVEEITEDLEDEHYQAEAEVRSDKKDYGKRKGGGQATASPTTPLKKPGVTAAVRHLNLVSRETSNPVLKTAAISFKAYLQ